MSYYTESQFILSAQSFTGTIDIASVCEAGSAATIDFMLFASSGANGVNGYLLQYDSRATDQPARIYRLDNGTATDIGTYNISANGGTALTGPQNLRFKYYPLSHHFAAYFNGQYAASAQDTTYTPNGQVGYGVEVASGYISNFQVSGHDDASPTYLSPTGHGHLIDLSESHTNKTQDYLPDGTNYARVTTNALTSNQIDFSKAGFANKTQDYVGDGTTYARTLGSRLAAGVPYTHQGIWSSATHYLKGDTVVYQSSYWLALANNTNSAPATNNANWQVVGTYSGFEGAWNSTTNYIAGAEVTDNGNFWVAVSANTNSEPTTTNANWQVAGPSNLDNVADGTTYKKAQGVDGTSHQLTYHGLYGDTSGDTTTSIVDAGNKRFVHGAMSGPVQSVVNSSSQITSGTAIAGRTEGIGTTVQNLDSSGIVTASGVDFARSYTNKIIDNVPDGTTYSRTKSSTLTTGVPNNDFMHQFPSAVIDTSGKKVIVSNLVG